MWSRDRARSLRIAVCAIVFAAMLGVRIEPVPDDDNDPIVDYRPQVSSQAPAPGRYDPGEDDWAPPPGPPAPSDWRARSTPGAADAQPISSNRDQHIEPKP